jgi:hypothetical protein
MKSDSESTLSPEPEGGPVLLVRVYDPVEAEIIVGKLRSSGIEAFVRHEALSVVYGLTVDGCGQQDIMVRAEDLGEARTALEYAGASETANEPEAVD